MPSRFFLDPWPPDYDSALQVDQEDDLPSPEVDIKVEFSEWKAIPRMPLDSALVMYFVDGVRRIEARLISQESDQITYGLFGSIGVGSVCCHDGSANMGSLLVRRYLIIGQQRERTETLKVGSKKITFQGWPTSGNTPVEMVAALQNLMRTAEADLGQRLLADETCIYVDGPLTFFSTAKQALVGVIKRIHRLYLPTECLNLLAELHAGERTPLFLIRDNKLNRYSCYLRLSEPARTEHRLAGIVRLEVRAAVDLSEIIALVNFAAHHLPRFASSPIRDPRAPQNLLPIGALEEELRRRLGDAVLIRRAIEERISEGVLV